MELLEAKKADAELIKAMHSLIRQLSEHANLPDIDSLNEIINSASTQLLMLREDDNWVGSISLVIYQIPTGRHARIEDVIVDSGYRGRGFGRVLMEEAVRRARKAGAASLSFTSRPTREVANKLYQGMGFNLHDTNVYKMNL